MKEKRSQALAKGYAGMRVSSNKAWLTAKDLREFLDSEKRLKEVIALQRVVFLCTYPLAISGRMNCSTWRARTIFHPATERKLGGAGNAGTQPSQGGGQRTK